MLRLKITDTTFRDAQQSRLATRMRTEDMALIAEQMDKIGFNSMDVWGGATFDVSLRFLNEDPWERLKTLKKLIRLTPLQMLVRGQNLVGYRPYANDVVEAFISYSAECGIDVFRVYDPLNDESNLELCLKAIKKCGKHAQLAICYSLTEKKMGGPAYNLDYYLKKAAVLQKMGADSICIKDMAGIMAPNDGYKLIKALKKILKVPLQLHCHCTSGFALKTYSRAVKAGVDIIDTTLAPLSGGYSQPAVEPIVRALQKNPRNTGLDLNQLLIASTTLEVILLKYQEFLKTGGTAAVDDEILSHQIPGGMITNLMAQLKELGKLDKLNEVLKEVPRVRKELGYPPLVTPISQMVGVQAVQNVLLGRYKLISTQVRDYILGLYGKPPLAVDADIQKLALKTYLPKKPPEAELEKARKEIEAFSQNMGDILIQALYDKGVGMDFLKRKYKIEKEK